MPEITSSDNPIQTSKPSRLSKFLHKSSSHSANSSKKEKKQVPAAEIKRLEDQKKETLQRWEKEGKTPYKRTWGNWMETNCG
ncbi:hypothetical protein CC78DRAFT_581349 [Lojkania enalia]|uniref:Uncharacterized protein n=1 Tax=Lojkania enalia TaxID=147567 RepID=A0A9P4K8D7_9PLEO|nr:hypothetical protein CC78DRAFT_581349 [Didymosphaeria enalia]